MAKTKKRERQARSFCLGSYLPKEGNEVYKAKLD